MTPLDACTSGTSRILSVASLQRLKEEALIPALADCEVRSMIKFLTAQSITPIEIHRQLYQLYGHTRFDGQHISWRSSAGRCLIIHPIARTSRPVMSIFSYISRNSCPDIVSVYRMAEKRRWVSQWSQYQMADFYDIGYKSWSYDMTNVLIPEVNMLKNSSTLTVPVPITISIKFGIVSVNGPRETYFLDPLRVCEITITFTVVLVISIRPKRFPVHQLNKFSSGYSAVLYIALYLKNNTATSIKLFWTYLFIYLLICLFTWQGKAIRPSLPLYQG